MFLICSASRMCSFCLLFWCSNIAFSVRIFRNSVVGHECFFKCCATELVSERCIVSLTYTYIYRKSVYSLKWSAISIWDDWPIFMISGSNEQLQQELEYTLLKPDCHSWGISKMQSGREDTLKERYAIKLYFKLGKMPQKHMECFRLLFDHLAWIEH